jgi:magnesium transporter
VLEIFVHEKGSDHIDEGFESSHLPQLLTDPNKVVWVDLEAPTESETKILSEVFHFHPLTIEDAVQTRNHPKVEQFADYLFFIVHGVKGETNSSNFVTRELDGYLGKNFILTFHHERFNSIDAVKRQIRGSIFAFKRGADYLLHQILDQLVDLYVPVVDDFDESIGDLEERVFRMRKSNNTILEEVMTLKRNVNRLKRISNKQREVLYRIAHGEFPQIDSAHLPFFRDVHDHLLRVVDLAENYRDLINGLMDIHLSVVANRTNDVMKVIAIFSAIMLPLSLIAGIYGMNFENIPELHTRYGYFYTIALMIFIALLLLIYFWRKGWIFDGEEEDGLERNEKEEQ